MPITTGAHPLALPGGMSGVTAQASSQTPLDEVANRFIPKPRKPPKIKKHAFGAKQPGAAFKK